MRFGFIILNTNLKTKVSKVISLKITTFNSGFFKYLGDI